MNTVRKIKKRVRELLEKNALESLVEFAMDNQRVVSALISMTYDKDSLITWRAIEAVGVITARISEKSPEQAGEIVRRLLWSVTEESGGIGWTALEMLAEIVINAPEKFRHIVALLPEFYDEEIFREGVLYAIGRIGESEAELFDDYSRISEIICEGLESNDPRIRGLAAWAYKRLHDRIGGIDRILVENLERDERTFTVYEKGRLVNKKINEVLPD
ncbi:MAG TPA: hypothetical protein ENK09_11880 [Nitrospirae bacterium]|nr:hypothetical protein [Nitrospirota bacterium]